MTAPGDRTLERIAALLNQAEGTDNAAEREAFMKKAQQLATIHSLDLARARSHTRSKENSTPIQRTITVGEQREHGRLVRIDLILGISHANDVKMTISHNRTRVYAHGFEEDINAVEALYASLVVQMADEAEKFLDKGEWKKDTVYRKKRVKVEGYWSNGADGYEDQWGYYPVPKQTARGEFQSAFASQIETRLMLAKREAEDKVIQEEKVRDKECVAGQENSEPGTELVLVQKKEEIDTFYAKKNPHLFKNNRRRGGYGGYQSNAYSDTARSAGREAGRNARIGSQGAVGGQRKAIG